VQTIDATYAGSEFAPEQIFEIAADAGVQNVTVDTQEQSTDATPIYYNICGMRLNTVPDHGIYIVRQGNAVDKIVR
jgi:hypothetical protein